MLFRLLSSVILNTLLLSASRNLRAQDSGFTEGYIITLEKDTVRGLVKHIQPFPYRILEDVIFKEHSDNDNERYTPKELIGFASGKIIYHSVLYQAADYTNQKAFMELAATGEVTLYYWTYTGMG